MKLLITSRASLRLQEEWLYPLAGMGFAGRDLDQSDSMHHYDAVELFVERARRADPNFALADEETHVVRVCRLVDGIPLALELAASWLPALSVRQIADEIESDFEILSSRHRNMAVHHDSVRTVMEHSWRLLTEKERAVLASLSAFRGGFRLSAAIEGAGATPLIVATWVDKSFLRRATSDRFDMHKLLHRFAEQQLAANPAEENSAP